MRDVSKGEGKGDGWVLERLAACVARGVGLEGLWRGQDDTMLECWHHHGCFVDSTREGRRAMRAAAGAWCLDSLVREEATGEVEGPLCAGSHARA